MGERVWIMNSEDIFGWNSKAWEATLNKTCAVHEVLKKKSKNT